MSGPISVLILGNPIAALLSAAALRAAAAVQAGYEQADQLHEQHERERHATRMGQTSAHEQSRRNLAEACVQDEASFQRLVGFAERLGIADRLRAVRPVRPDAANASELAAYSQNMHALMDELRAVLLTEAARQKQSLPAEEIEFTAPGASFLPRSHSNAQRLLARISHLGAVPENIAALAHELDQELPGTRADLLATELRARIQAHVEALQKRQVQQATALIVEQSLKDLGYQVEAVAETLFVEGGTIHFRRPGWGEYMVRMRVDALAGAANFNVIRAVAAGSNERSVLDHLAEDRWCAEFPALLRALEARGIGLQVTRRLQAGELPVQSVDAPKLPQFADEESAAPQSKPLTREIK